jgi:hypothetical protein
MDVRGNYFRLDQAREFILVKEQLAVQKPKGENGRRWIERKLKEAGVTTHVRRC